MFGARNRQVARSRAVVRFGPTVHSQIARSEHHLYLQGGWTATRFLRILKTAWRAARGTVALWVPPCPDAVRHGDAKGMGTLSALRPPILDAWPVRSGSKLSINGVR